MEKELPNTSFRVEESNELPLAIVAGGAGFIGSHLCESLLSQNLSVICLDDLSTGSEVNIAKIKNRDNFRFLKCDISESLPDGLPNPTYIFHLAGIAEETKQGAVGMLSTNAAGTKNLLDLAVASRGKFLLVSSVGVYQGKISETSLINYAGSLENDTHNYSHNEAKRYAEVLTAEYVLKYALEAKIVRLWDVYGPRMRLDSGEELTGLIKQAIYSQSVSVPGDGLKDLYPTYVSDVVYAISKAMFMPGDKNKIFTAVNPGKISCARVAAVLKEKTNRELKLSFGGAPQSNLNLNLSGEAERTEKELGWRPLVSLDDGIAKTIDYFQNQQFIHVQQSEITASGNIQQPVEMTEVISGQKPKPQQIMAGLKKLEVKQEEKIRTLRSLSLPHLTKPTLGILMALGIVAAVLFLPIIIFLASVVLGARALNQTRDNFSSARFEQAAQSAKAAEGDFENSRSIFNTIAFIPGLIGFSKNTSEIDSLLSLGQKGSEAAYHLSVASWQLSLVGARMLGQENLSAPDFDWNSILNAASLELSMTSQDLDFLQAELNQTEIPSWLPGDTARKYLPQARQMISFSQKILPEIPRLIAIDGKRKYLVLLQNNSELRPTGGFIGSYAVANWEKGRLLDYRINDVYTADGQLRGKVTPPDEILHFLGQPNWYLRDSNWSPDFTLSAQRAAWFLNKETGENVDGVIGIDLYLVQKILSAVGPVNVSDFNETVTAENFFDRAEYHAEINFFPGSTQKRDFLGAVAQSIVDKVLSGGKTGRLPEILQSVMSGLNEKNIQVYLPAPGEIDPFREQNWTGELEPTQAVLSTNNLAIVDANLGANKSNYFIRRSVNVQTEISKGGDVMNTITLVYRNTATTDTWPAGRLKDYIRFYIPEGSSNLSLDLGDGRTATYSSVLNENVLKSLGSDQFLVYSSSESGALSLGALFEVPVSSLKTVTFRYTSPRKIDFNWVNPQYNFYLRKQAGTTSDELTYTIDYPSFLVPIVPPQIAGTLPVVSQSRIRYNTNLSQDVNARFIWKKLP